MANPTVQSYTTVRTILSVSTLDIDKPSGTSSGDLLILIVNNTTARTVSASGFTQIDTIGGTINRLTALYKVAGNSEPSTYTYTLSGISSGGQNACLIRVRNAANPNSNSIESATNFGTANPSVAPTLTPSDNESLVIRVCGTLRGNGIITVTPATQIFIDSIDGELPHLATSYENANNIDIGTANFTQPNAREYATITIAIAKGSGIVNPLTLTILGIGTDPLKN